jgi:hypothetical protein
MYGYACSREMIGLPLANFLDRTRPNNDEFLRRFIRGSYRLSNVETQENDKDGNPKWFTNTLVGTLKEGSLVGAWGTQLYIT